MEVQKVLRDDTTKMTKLQVLEGGSEHIAQLTLDLDIGGPEVAKLCTEILARKSRERRIASDRRNVAITKKVFEAIIFIIYSNYY